MLKQGSGGKVVDYRNLSLVCLHFGGPCLEKALVSGVWQTGADPGGMISSGRSTF